ncbi:hypothetical protein NIES2109_60730 (plasmid) [Nostoc sp. HK-01]|nr:hypothetical protein NIES2109_60730 [Nostoc sp. HK-01]
MKNENACLLEIMFDKTQNSAVEIQSKIEKLLKQKLRDITKLEALDSSHKTVKLVICGSLNTIDECHDLINQFIIESKLNCIRITDDAGDIIRERAYPILSEIEQRFRQFINQAILDVGDVDFEYWETIADSKLQDKVELIRLKSQESRVPLHPLECTLFEDLLDIIESKVSKLSEDQPLYVADIIELLSRSTSIKKLKSEIEKSVEKISYWDRIFSRYFQDKQQWNSIKQSLKFVINERNKVMHHRPIRLGVINALLSKKNEIFSILETANFELTQEEKIETQQDIKDLQTAVDKMEYRLYPLGNSLIPTDEFLEDLEMLSVSEQKNFYERLYFLEHLANNDLLMNHHSFNKLPIKLHANNIYIFKVNRLTRILCKLDKHKDYQHPVITLIGIFKRNSNFTEDDLLRKIGKLED